MAFGSSRRFEISSSFDLAEYALRRFRITLEAFQFRSGMEAAANHRVWEGTEEMPSTQQDELMHAA